MPMARSNPVRRIDAPDGITVAVAPEPGLFAGPTLAPRGD
jgi:hypothetical protein